MARRLDVPIATIMQAVTGIPPRESATYRLATRSVALPPAGRLGVLLEQADDGIEVRSLTEDSAARDAGVQPLDRIVQLDGQEIGGFADVRIALLNKRPGDSVPLRLARPNGTGSTELKVRVRLR